MKEHGRMKAPRTWTATPASRRICGAVAMYLTALTCGQAQAAAPEECGGILHKKGQQLWFGGERGEGESICMIAPAQIGKVLHICAAGRYCRVSGTSTDCEGTGECMEINRVFTVTGKRPGSR
jgi:hypothetical protein